MVIGYGARAVVVPGQSPMGCLPMLLSRLRTNDTASYDEFQCLMGLNSISKSHNHLLKQAIEALKNEYPNVSFIYSDYYYAFTWLLRNAHQLGKSLSLCKFLKFKGLYINDSIILFVSNLLTTLRINLSNSGKLHLYM